MEGRSLLNLSDPIQSVETQPEWKLKSNIHDQATKSSFPFGNSKVSGNLIRHNRFCEPWKQTSSGISTPFTSLPDCLYKTQQPKSHIMCTGFSLTIATKIILEDFYNRESQHRRHWLAHLNIKRICNISLLQLLIFITTKRSSDALALYSKNLNPRTLFNDMWYASRENSNLRDLCPIFRLYNCSHLQQKP